MKSPIKNSVQLTLLFFVLVCCSSDDTATGQDNAGEFPTFGEMQANINGETSELRAKKAKQFSSPFLQIAGTSCNRRILIGFDIPFSTGMYTLETLGDVFVFLNAASSCEGELGGNSPQSIIEAEVAVTEFTPTTVRGTFRITTGENQAIRLQITDGIFNVERE